MGAKGSCQEVSAMMARDIRGSEWPRAIVQIKRRFDSVIEVFPGIEVYPVGRTTYPQVRKFSLGSQGFLFGLVTQPWVMELHFGSCDAPSDPILGFIEITPSNY
ncbi:hypothetical protein TorRG33x02_155180 [Trema orientale]|uniref:Uncharacterized protein n=1 Tax=Trema orientale TaxID=63057 RepID=A0A2P5ESV3_TREOI|nr:hypothetical protein TorRG33x02_155180 [Trema orientale]